MIEALFYEKKEERAVQCRLCGHECIIRPGKRGICCVRENKEGTLYSLNSDRLISSSVDPIEKKPLYHFLPGSSAFSIAAMGCNFHCSFCQNVSISQVSCSEGVYGQKITFEDVLKAALQSGAASLSYTYSEPTVFYEMVRGVGVLAREKGLKNTLVSNGFMSDDVARDMLSFMDGANIDLKFFRDESYRKLTGGNLEKVKSSIEIFAGSPSLWIEITTLLIPGINDSTEELKALSSWIASLDKNIPWHISRFFPHHKMIDKRPTPVSTLERAYETGKEQGLKFVYLGNVYDPDRENTICPSCGEVLIRRSGFWIDALHVLDGKCRYCRSEIPGVWK
ncbi:MAG: AmmeMemoRadiSam system radical SAM enzyme [Candidatus Aureabacteria bacterium]|nr:AmmeMemoRadiSam system radical SAM enzyme [Candidatus Auribacterota bacterium]